MMATIKLYELFVLTIALLSEVTYVTSADYSARSLGDLHITTIDKVEYDFNGHGEYIFLHMGNTTVQVRTDYMIPGNKDITIFVAVAIKDDIGQFEAQLNRTSGVVTVYKDGVAECSSNDSPPQGGPSNTMFPCGLSSMPPRLVRWVLVGNGKVSFVLKGFGSYLKTLSLYGGSVISITLEGIKDNISHNNLTGLAGGSVNIKALNGTLFNVSKPLDMFEFGESLRISENESLFNYSLSSGDYSTYNTLYRPTFYEDYLTNLTALFNLNGHQHNDSDIDEFDKTCNESKVRDECLLAIARSDDIAAGEVVNINYRHEQYLYYWRHVNECLNTSYVDQCTTHGGVCQNLHGSWNCTCPLDTLWMDVGTEETPIYRCQKNHTYVGNVTFVSILNITEDDIRDFVTKKLNTALSNSTMNGSTDPPLTVKQLFVSSTIKKINWKHESHSEFYEVMFTLRFGLPMATRTLQDILSSLPTRDGDIYDMHFVVFNESENKLCDFPNECEVISTICRTENGTLQCTCKDGFIKSSSPTICLDRDECQEHGYCLQGDCQNTHGSWICQCPSGYENNTTAPNKITCQDIDECNDTHKNKCENGNCTNTNGSYICQCHIGFVNNDNDNTTCHDIDECADVNQCRDGTCVNTNGSYKCDCHDGYHHDGNDNITCLDMNECNDTNQCRDGKCINTNGSFICECYDGFHHNGNDKTTCLDINECTNQTRCHNGICSNTVGSWHCDCFNGYQHNDTDIQSCIDINECQQYTNACSGSVSSFFPCVNLMGSWRCNCESGHPVDFNATSKLCSGVFRYLAYLLIAPHNKTNANNSLQMFIQQEFFSYYVQKFPNDGMKVTTLEIIFRPDNSSISAMFVLTFDILKSKDDIEKEWKIFKDKTCDPVCNSNGTMFFISPGDFILEGKNKGICTLQNTCNVESTDCISNNGQTTFECKSGFHKSSESSSCCEDINECTNTLCDNGTCINTNGSWHCDCYYGFKHTDSKNQSCEGDKQTIQVLQSSFTFTVTVSPDMTVLKTTLSKIIMDAYESKYNRSDIFVIILNITTRSEQTNRFVRDTSADSSKGIALLCMYEVHFTTPAPVIPEQKTLTAYLNEHQDSPAYSDMDIHLQAEEAITVHEAATTTKTSTTTASTTATPPKSKTTDESAKGTKTMLIAIGSSLGGLVVILTVLVGCLCWRKRQPEKTKLDSMPEHITMDTFGPGHDFKAVNPAYSSSHHLNQSVMYDHFHGGHGSFNNAPYHRSREELSNSYNHAFHHQNRESLYRTSSLPGLPRIENGAVKVLPSGEPQRPPSPIPDYHDPDVRGHGRNPPSPKPDYMPHHEHNFESKRSYPIQNGIHDHVVRNGVSVLPMARPRSMDNLAPNYNHLPSGPIYSQPHKQRRGSFGNY